MALARGLVPARRTAGRSLCDRPFAGAPACPTPTLAAPVGDPSSLARHHEIVAVDHLVAAAVAEDRLDLAALVAGNSARVGARVGGEPASDLAAVAPAHEHGIAALEVALDRDHARRQE